MSTNKGTDPVAARRRDDDVPDEIDFFGGVRGKYHERLKDGFTVRIVSDEEDRRRPARRAVETGSTEPLGIPAPGDE